MPRPDGPIVAVDIDGTLGAYHQHFRQFAQLWTGRTLRWDWDPAFEGSFSRALHMSKAQYRQCKLAFRQGGLKRAMPPFEDIRELTVHLRKAGAQVWICTTRPYNRFDSVDPDTRHWLRRNKLQWDGLLYGDTKYKDLVKIVGRDRVVAVYDDLPEQHEIAASLGLPAVMRCQEHNQWWPWDKADSPVGTTQEALDHLMEYLSIWKEDHRG